MKSDNKSEESIFGEVKSIFSHSMIYGVGNIASKVIGFLMIPVYTRFLTPADYGTIELIDLVLAVAGLILYDLIVEAIFRFYYKYDDVLNKKEVISSALIAHGCISIVIAGVGLAMVDQIATLVFGSDEYSPFFVISFVSFIFMQLNSIPMSYLRIKQKPWMFIGVSMASLILALSLNIYLIVFRNMGIYGVLYSGLISNGCLALFLVIKTFAEVGFRFSVKKVVAMFKYGAPMILSGAGMFSLNFSNRFFLAKYALLSDVGLFALGSRFGFMIRALVIGPFLNSWDAKIFKIAKEKDAKAIFARTLTYFVYVVIFIGLCMSVLIKDILTIMATPSFYDAHKIVPVLCLGYIFIGFYYHFYIGFLLKDKTVYIGIIVGIAALLNLILNLVLIPISGIIGAAWALTISYFTMSFVAYILAYRVYFIKYEWNRILKISCVALILYYASKMVIVDSIILSVGIRSLILLGYPTTLWIIGFYSNEEMGKIKEKAKSLFKRSEKMKLFTNQD